MDDILTAEMQYAVFIFEVVFHLLLSIYCLEFPEYSSHSRNLLIKPLGHSPRACAQVPPVAGNSAPPLTTLVI